MKSTVAFLSRAPPQARLFARAPHGTKPLKAPTKSMTLLVARAALPPDSLGAFDDDESLFAVEVDAVNQGHGVCDSQLLLRRKGTRESMLILLDSAAAAALHDGLTRSRGPRPGPHDVFASALTTLGARVERVVITDLVGDLYHARACVAPGGGGGGGESEIDGASPSAGGCIDCRPSDGINLALRTGAPIFVSAEVWREAARIAIRSPSPDDESEQGDGSGGFQQQQQQRRGGSPSTSSSSSSSPSSFASGPAVAIHSPRFGAPPGHPALGRYGTSGGGASGDNNNNNNNTNKSSSSSSSFSSQPPPLAAAAARARAALKRASSRAALAQLRARMAAAEGRFDDAARLRDAGRAALLGPFSLAPLAAALDAALSDLRYEEAEALAERLAEEGDDEEEDEGEEEV